MDVSQNTPLVSIILLSLLRQTETARCIKSIFAHTDVPFEIIIADMGKSAKIAEWLGQLTDVRPGIQVVLNVENIGTAKGRNQGIGLAGGEYIFFLDNDAEVTAGWLCQAGNLIGVLEPDGGMRVCELKPIVANVRNFDYNFPKAWFSAAADKNRLTVKGCSCTHACFINASDDLRELPLD